LARTAAHNDPGRIDGLSVNSGLYGPSGSRSLIDRGRHRVSKRAQYFVGPRGSSGSPGLARSPASSLSSAHAPAGADSGTSLTSHSPHPAPLRLSISADLKRASRARSATIKRLRRSGVGFSRLTRNALGTTPLARATHLHRRFRAGRDHGRK